MNGNEEFSVNAGEYAPDAPALQVIVLGSGGGPTEDNVTGFLVRSLATNWCKGSMLVVDAGTHLAALIRLLEQNLSQPDLLVKSAPKYAENVPPAHSQNASRLQSIAPETLSSPQLSPRMPTRVNTPRPRRSAPGSLSAKPPGLGSEPRITLVKGPFAGLELPYESSRANAAHITREIVSTYLITHPHLDHMSGFVINTASFHNTYRPKRLAGLPSTIEAFKTHIFNDVIWPNLSDEEGGVGLLTYMRLAEGVNVAIGEGEGMGYIEICEGLGVKSWSVSHGHCMKRHSHRGSNAGTHEEALAQAVGGGMSGNAPRKSLSMASDLSSASDKPCVYDSSAFFIRDDATGREILIFGDVEPDTLSLHPRTQQVWTDAAPKIATGILSAIFIECSYADAQKDEILFGHLAPRHLISELEALAVLVTDARQQLREEIKAAAAAEATEAEAETTAQVAANPSDHTMDHPSFKAQKKRKREGNDASPGPDPEIAIYKDEAASGAARQSDPNIVRRTSPEDMGQDNADASSGPDARHARFSSPRKSQKTSENSHDVGDERNSKQQQAPAQSDGPEAEAKSKNQSNDLPLQGLQIVVIHVKETLLDGPPVGDIILEQLERRARDAGLGCSFVISQPGQSLLL
ncbi:hypothetical protein L228DRAFT_250814 [Xylona heveae TC161]|uniref:Cyclic-AMP phosphodiesterase n=1 Tax=Xylona heveae (strain CBS 132557 / TC161) TaxID=1328760 RepID=A0A164ZZD2_XYLHT|nr:hypothetical protein L228DRAFT_250814 [Xylona heveae TC161]KZF19738.1 hypothetical protein L228DRAFT_250814 [Xylona heveae TC161]